MIHDEKKKRKKKGTKGEKRGWESYWRDGRGPGDGGHGLGHARVGVGVEEQDPRQGSTGTA